MSNMIFTKTSQKFGQWADPKANNVYGLGFNSENDLNKFSEKFKEAKSVAGAATPSSGTDSVKSESLKSDSLPDLNGMTKGNSSSRSLSSNGSLEDDAGGSHKSFGNSTDSQLKYENDRLKKALAQSSANAKKWEAELQTLKNNNAKLTAALQESTVNVEKWKEQLNNYKDENTRLKKKLVELNESGGTNGQLMERMRQDWEQRLVELTGRLTVKDEELARATQENSEINSYRELNADMTVKIQQLQSENRKLMQSNAQFEQRIKELKSNELKIKELRDVESNLKDNISQLMALQQRMSKLTQ
ncbi:homer protein homolog 2-like isoform X2 [Rhopilema esculentum]